MGYYKINIQGIVQGVGFRPFLFNLANNFGLTGSIINKGNVGVELLVYGSDKETITHFISSIKNEKPSISYIENIGFQELKPEEIKNDDLELIKKKLVIKPSEGGIGPSVTSPPDIAICSNCIEDMNDSSKIRFYNYPFTACAVCGPRFTTIKELPYDRERTTMDEFPFCKSTKSSSSSCLDDYKNHIDRRFHAQTYSCFNCGPNYFFLYNPDFVSHPFKNESSATKMHEILSEPSKISKNAFENIKIASKYILSGKIIAIMGIGGVHIVGDARESKSY